MGVDKVKITRIGAVNVSGIDDGTWNVNEKSETIARGTNGSGKSTWLALLTTTQALCLDLHWMEKEMGRNWPRQEDKEERSNRLNRLTDEKNRPCTVMVEWTDHVERWELEWTWFAGKVMEETLRMRSERTNRWKTAIKRVVCEEGETHWTMNRWMTQRKAIREATRVDAMAAGSAMRIDAAPVAQAVRSLTHNLFVANTSKNGIEKSAKKCTDPDRARELCEWMNRHGSVDLANLKLHEGRLIVERTSGTKHIGVGTLPKSMQWLWSIAGTWYESMKEKGTIVIDDIDTCIDEHTRKGLLEEARTHGVQVIATARGGNDQIEIER